jgi:hypothetical protein
MIAGSSTVLTVVTRRAEARPPLCPPVDDRAYRHLLTCLQKTFGPVGFCLSPTWQ